MARAGPALPPPTAQRVARLPLVALDALRLARVTWRRHPGMWWFACRDDTPAEAGRFDRAHPRGTCYFATDPVAALIEKLSDPDDLDPLVSVDTVRELVVWEGTLDLGLELADTTARAGRLPKELGTSTPYEQCWAWADALDEAGRAGLRWWLRLDPGPGRGVAVFGPASSTDSRPDPGDWPELPRRVQATAYLRPLRDSFDIVEYPPTLGQLDVVTDPE